MKQAQLEVLPGKKTTIYGYNGITPGPTIKVRQGRKAVVRQINSLPDISFANYKTWTSVHLHGSDSLPQYDGYASDITNPGEFKDYHYPNNQNARTLWYHDHGVHHTSENAYMGLAGLYLTHDPHERSLGLPSGYHNPARRTGYDVPLVLRDAVFAQDGSLIFDREEEGSLFGDVILVNGRPWPRMRVERRKYRFRILNASISRSYKLALSSGESMTVVGTDGGLMPRPAPTGSLRVGMAERYEVVIDFAKYKVGQSVVLKNLDLPNNREEENTHLVMRFDVVSDATDTSNNEVPSVLNVGDHPHSPMNLDESQAVRTRRFEFGREIVNGEEMWTINNRIWDPNRVDARPDPGDVEIWEFQNKSGGWFHPVHIHLVDYKILDRRDSENGTRRPPH
ncbi:MAG: multicopper oxidase family protein, partial [Rubrobacter sp.]